MITRAVISDAPAGLQRTIDEALAEVDKTSIQLAIDEAVEEVEYRQKYVIARADLVYRG